MVIRNYKSLNIHSTVDERKLLIKNEFALKNKVFINLNDRFWHVKCLLFMNYASA